MSIFNVVTTNLAWKYPHNSIRIKLDNTRQNWKKKQNIKSKIEVLFLKKSTKNWRKRRKKEKITVPHGCKITPRLYFCANPLCAPKFSLKNVSFSVVANSYVAKSLRPVINIQMPTVGGDTNFEFDIDSFAQFRQQLAQAVLAVNPQE